MGIAAIVQEPACDVLTWAGIVSEHRDYNSLDQVSVRDNATAVTTAALDSVYDYTGHEWD